RGGRGDEHAKLAPAPRRSGVPPQVRMPVDAMDGALTRREQVAEQNIAPQMRHRNDNGHVRVSEDALPDLDRAPDAATVGRAVERGTHLVLAERRSKALQSAEDLRQALGHPFRTAAAALAGDSDSAAIGEA